MEVSKYKICPECGKQNPTSLLECRYCEADLTGVKVVDSTMEQKNEVEAEAVHPSQSELVRICECGAENAPQARKCTVCGEDISDIIPTPIERTTPKAFTYELTSTDGSFAELLDKPLVVIGREAELKDYLSDKVYVSRQHARLTVVAGKVFLENLSRTNKTYVNNIEIPDGTPTALNNGDEIGLGGKVIENTRQEKAAYLVFRVKS
jgi:ribosomal protein L40E